MNGSQPVHCMMDGECLYPEFLILLTKAKKLISSTRKIQLNKLRKGT